MAHSLAGRFEVIEVEGDAVFVHHQGEDLAGAEVMSVAQRCYSEECDDVADLLGGAEAAERDLPSDELGRTKGIPLDMPCFDADATVACLDQA